MVPAAFADQCLITVRDVTIEITPELINAYHGTPDRRELDISYGISKPTEFRATFSPIIASSLRRNGSGRWDTGNNAILKKELHYDMAFMLLFVKSTLRPSTHTTTVDSDVARILYSLQHNHPMDVGHLIWLEMLDAGNSLDGVLPFPCMITHFCEEARIRTTELRSTLRNFNITNYNTQVRIAEGRQERAPAAAARRRNVAPRNDDDDDEEEVPPELPRDTPAWGRVVFRHVVAGNEASRVANEENRVAIDGVQDRIDSLVSAMAQGGFDVSNVAERPRRRTRRRPMDGASTSHSHPDDEE